MFIVHFGFSCIPFHPFTHLRRLNVSLVLKCGFGGFLHRLVLFLLFFVKLFLAFGIARLTIVIIINLGVYSGADKNRRKKGERFDSILFSVYNWSVGCH